MMNCKIPFNQLYIHSSGKVYPCSFLQNNIDFVLGDIQTQKLSDIWNSPLANQLREAHRQSLPKRCLENIANFNCCNIGQRPYFVDINATQPVIRRLDIMLDSACNLTCNMCTNIYDETGGLKSEFFWENNQDVFSSINELELVGGEPLISPHFKRLVKLVAPINANLDWRITTNAHFKISNELLNHFSQINLRVLTISVDSLNKSTFELIRKRSHFNTVYENVFELSKSITKININMVIQQINRDEVLQIYEWCLKNGFGFYPILLLYPSNHSISQLSPELQSEWIRSIIAYNNIALSKEIFFLIKKSISSLAIKHDKELLIYYYDHLKSMEQVLV